MPVPWPVYEKEGWKLKWVGRFIATGAGAPMYSISLYTFTLFLNSKNDSE